MMWTFDTWVESQDLVLLNCRCLVYWLASSFFTFKDVAADSHYSHHTIFIREIPRRLGNSENSHASMSLVARPSTKIGQPTSI